MKLLLVAGARPNFMKISPLVRAIDDHNQHNSPQIQRVLVHTGQHYDVKMSEVFFAELGIPSPDINLEVGSGSHAVQTANVMVRFEQTCLEEKPDCVIVVGDVNSTMACTLVAAKLQIKVAHVEAGLRSFDRTMPEEVNRIVTDSLADLLFTPSNDAGENLRREGVPESKIKLVGNIMIDTLIANLEKARKRETHSRLGLREKEFVYVTLHRPSNVDDKETLSAVMGCLEKLASLIPVCFPIHPRTKKMLETYGIANGGNERLRIIDPIGYHDSICLAEHAGFVLTDSGGIQEETTFFQTPCLTLRPNTERPVTVTEGSNKLTDLHNLWPDIESLLNGSARKGRVPALWDGHTAERIINCLLD
ncbi:MAG: UDP-N-acetylglucosamine 2-epimerase (non-hydrolyzing) [Pseudomonadota bacterium]